MPTKSYSTATPSKSAMNSCWHMPRKAVRATKVTRSVHRFGNFCSALQRRLQGSPRNVRRLLKKERLEPAEKFRPFLVVLDRDAGSSPAAIELALAQPSISSQLIDNLNASIRLRALLTDLFLLGEVLRLRTPMKYRA
jgi:hypothetical protein